MKKRRLELVVLSDIHLGNLDCHANECIAYLNSIRPKILVLNGGIVDVSSLDKAHFPSSHIKVIKKIISMASKGTEVYYVVGNNQKKIDYFSGTSMGTLHIVDKLVLNLNGKKTWFFNGDVFDHSYKIVTWLSKLGIKNYNYFMKLNALYKRTFLKTKNVQLSSSIKALNHKTFISCFEKYVIELAIYNDYDYVVCGHTHKPKKEIKQTLKGKCTYLNSGDWVKNLTALEYSFKRWKIYSYNNDKLIPFYVDEDLKEIDIQEIINKITTQKEGTKVEDKQNISIDNSIF